MYFRSKIREEIASLKKQYQMDKQSKDKLVNGQEKAAKSNEIKGSSENHYINDFIESKEKYTAKVKLQPKGQSRWDIYKFYSFQRFYQFF